MVLFVRSRRVVTQVDDGKGSRFSGRSVDSPSDALVAFGANGVERLLVLQHFLGGVGNFQQLGHQPIMRHRAVPFVAQRSRPSTLATHAGVARLVW